MLIITSVALLIAILLIRYMEYIYYRRERKKDFCELEQYLIEKKNEFLHTNIIPFMPVLLVFGLAVMFMCWLCTDERNKNYDYKAELKSGEVVKANDCITSDDDVLTCVVKIDDEDKEYIVTSYRKKILFEIMKDDL